MSNTNDPDTGAAAVTVTMDAESLEMLTHAAGCWRQELQECIIPASQQFDDSESAQAQQAEAEGIAEAIAAARRAQQLNEDARS
jgi:acetylglutamate kinase